MFTDGLDLASQCRNAMPDFTAVHFQFRFARTAGTDPTSEPGQIVAISAQPRQSVVELSVFNLKLPFFRAGSSREDIENEACSVHNLGFEGLFEVARLAGRKFLIENDNVSAFDENCFLDLIDLSLPDVCGGIGTVAVLNDLANDSRAGGNCQLAQFVKSTMTYQDRAFAQVMFVGGGGGAAVFAVVIVEMACLKIS
jgi:hypothetical protein